MFDIVRPATLCKLSPNQKTWVGELQFEDASNKRPSGRPPRDKIRIKRRRRSDTLAIGFVGGGKLRVQLLVTKREAARIRDLLARWLDTPVEESPEQVEDGGEEMLEFLTGADGLLDEKS